MTKSTMWIIFGVLLASPTVAIDDHDHGEDRHGNNNEQHSTNNEKPSKHLSKDAGAQEHHDHPAVGEGREGHQHGESEMSDQAHDHEHDEGGHDSPLRLQKEQIETVGIQTLVVQLRTSTSKVVAPGEVSLNAYQTTKVSPRIAAQIVKRHVQLGAHVAKGQVLLTLSSVAVSQAQGELFVSDRQWKRVKKLGRGNVSARRFIEAQVARQQAYARLRAYGMTEQQIEQFLQQDSAAAATGELVLLSPQSGTVIKDDFVVGEIADPGRELYVITNEHKLWVEARLAPEDAVKVKLGAKGRIRTRGQWVDASVIHAQHVLDERTRTLSIRLEVDNHDDQLHPGEFVKVRIETAGNDASVQLPVAAVLRNANGEWYVFIEESSGTFRAKTVRVLRTVGDQLEITGLTVGEKVVSKGAFFIQSEIAKSGFDTHNH